MAQPTPADFTDAWAEAVAYADPAATHYDTLTFASSMDTATLMIAVGDSKLITPQGTYLPYPVEFTPADTEGGIVGQLQIRIPYLSLDAQAWITAAAAAGAWLSVTWRQYLAAGVDPAFEYRMPFTITKIEIVNNTASMSATLPDLVNTPCCRKIMSPRVLPGLVGLA